jgi:hypothetical protein
MNMNKQNKSSSNPPSRICAVFVFGVVLMLAMECVNAAMILDFSAEAGVEQTGSIVTGWQDQSGNNNNATTASQVGPVLTNAIVNGRSHPVLRFDGSNVLTAAQRVPPTGTLFLVFSNADLGPIDRRVIGWADSCCGSNGIDILPAAPNLNVATRINYNMGDIMADTPVTDMEVITVSWGIAGVILERRLANGEVLTFSNPNINSVGDGGFDLQIGAPGDYPNAPSSLPLQGDIAALRVYDEQLPASQRDAIAKTLYDKWVAPTAFAKFLPVVNMKFGPAANDDSANVISAVLLGADSNGVNIGTEPFRFKIGGKLALSLEGGSFVKKTSGPWTYTGNTPDNTHWNVTVISGGERSLLVTVKLTGNLSVESPFSVTLGIGDDGDSVQQRTLTAGFEK